MRRWRTLVGCLLALFTICAQGATFNIRVTDAAGEGLNDSTPFAPIGGNTATTLGQARLNVLNEAARVWGLLLQSNVIIQVDAAFDALTCGATSGTLGSAGPRSIFRNVPGGMSPDVYYVGALADALAGSNLSSNPQSPDIGATFNSSIDSDPNCLGGRGFYYGFDHNRGTKADFLLVVLHEFAHGLGFTSEVDLATGKGFVSNGVERFDAYTYRIFDEQLNLAWTAMTADQRVQSATHSGFLAWSGPNVNAQIGRFGQGFTANGRIRLYAPATVSNGSSVSHFDTAVSQPNVLMEPNLPSSLTGSVTDITVCALQDIGWTVTVCPNFTAPASNSPPTAANLTVSTITEQSVDIMLVGTDPDNDPLTYTILTPPTHGTLSGTAPNVSYKSNAGYSGSDSFTYGASDPTTSSAAATVSITVQPPPQLAATPTNNGGGGGGALTSVWLSILVALGFVHSRSRRRIALQAKR